MELAVVVFTLKIWSHYPYEEWCEIYTDHKSLKYFFSQKEVNMKQHRWLELVKDYDYEILYQLGKANVVADVISRKNYGSLVVLAGIEKSLQQVLINAIIEVVIGKLANLSIQ